MSRRIVAPPYRAAKEQAVNIVQRDVRLALQNVANVDLVQGRSVSVTLSSTATTNVSHGLGRPYTGFLVIDHTTSAIIFRDATVTTVDPKQYIPLKASAGSPTVTLWIF